MLLILARIYAVNIYFNADGGSVCAFFFFKFGGHLLSHIVSNAVPSAAWVLTIVFGMGTGVSPRRIATKKFRYEIMPYKDTLLITKQ